MKKLYCQSEIEAAELDGEWVLLHTTNYTVTRVNEIGGVVWKLLTQFEEVEKIIEIIQSDYAIPYDQAEEDVLSYLHQLQELGLVYEAS